jgi:hypothetical protein
MLENNSSTRRVGRTLERSYASEEQRLQIRGVNRK